MGVGFVGAVMAGVVADSTDDKGNSAKFVIGMQRPSTRSYWKIPYLNRESPRWRPKIRRWPDSHALRPREKDPDGHIQPRRPGLADVVVVDVQCDYHKETLGDVTRARGHRRAGEEPEGYRGKDRIPAAWS